jgi:hypothetical protein
MSSLPEADADSQQMGLKNWGSAEGAMIKAPSWAEYGVYPPLHVGEVWERGYDLA